MNEKQLKFLWDNYANNKGFVNYDEFKSLMASDNNRKMFFDDSNKELGFTDYNEFETILGVKKKGGTTQGQGQPVQQPGKPSAPSFGQKVMTEALVSGQPVMKGVQKKPVEKKPYQDITYRREELPSETTQMPETPLVKAAKKDFKQTQVKPPVQVKSTPEELEEIQKKTEKVDQTGLVLNNYQSTAEIVTDLESLNEGDVNAVFTRIQRRPDLYAKYSGRTPEQIASFQGYQTRELYEADRDLVYKNYLADLESQKLNHDKAVKKANIVSDEIIKAKVTPESYRNFVKDKTETGMFGQEIAAGPVVDMDAVDREASAIAEKYNLPTDGEAWRLLKNNIKSEVNLEIDRPQAVINFNNDYPELEKKRKELFEGGFQADEAIYARVDSQLTALESQYQEEAKREFGVIDAEYKQKADKLNKEYADYTAQIKQQQESLTALYQSGQIDQMQYEDSWAKLSEGEKTFYENYKREFPDLTQYVVKANEINSKYNRKFELQKQAIASKADAEMQAAFKKYAAEYKEDPEILRQINEAYKASFVKATEQRTAKMGQAAQLSANPFSSFYQATASSLGGVFKGWGGSLNSRSLELLGESMEQNFMMPKARTEEFSDWVDPQNAILLAGQLAGSQIPSMAVGAAVAIGSQGAGLPVAAQLIAGGLAGWASETVDTVGRSYLDRFERTGGNVVEANLAAQRSLQSQYDIMFTYSLDALPFVGKALKFIPTKVGRVVAGGVAELGTEMAQEYPQNIADENIQAGNEPWANLNEALKDTKRMKETLISIGPVAILGGASQLGTKSRKSELRDANIAMQQKSALNTALPDQKRQYIQNMVFSKDAKFAKGVIGNLFATGQIDEQTSQDLLVEIERSEKIKESGKSAGLSGSKLNVYGFYSARAEEAERNAAKFGKDPILSENYKQMAKEYRDAGLDFMKGNNPDLLTITYADGSQAIMVPEDANALFSDATALSLLNQKAVSIEAYKEGGQGAKIIEELNARVEAYAQTNRYTEAAKIESPMQTLRQSINERVSQLEAEKPDLDAKQKQEEIDRIEQELSESFAAVGAAFEEKEKQKRDEGITNRDAEVEMLQSQRMALGIDDVLAFFSDMKPLVSTMVERMESGQAAPQSGVKAASDYLYAKYKELGAMRSDPNRMMTIAQIESIQAQIEQDLETLAGTPPSQKTEARDQENIQGIPSQVREGQEPVAAQPIQGTSQEAPTAGGVLQAQEEVTPTTEAAPKPTQKTPQAEPVVQQPQVEKDIFIGSITQTSLGWESATKEQGPGDMRSLGYTAKSGVEIAKGEDGKTYAVSFSTRTSDGKPLTDKSGRPGFFSVSVSVPDGATQEQINKAKQKALEQFNLLHPFVKADKNALPNTTVLGKVLSGDIKIKPTTTVAPKPTITENKPTTEAAPEVAPEPTVKPSRRERLAKMFETSDGEIAAEKVASFLGEANIGVEVLDPKSFEEKGKQRNFEGGADGIFLVDNNTGKIYLNKERIKGAEGKTIAFHEGIHPVVNIIRNTNPKLYSAIVDGLKAEAVKNAGVAEAAEAVASSEYYQEQGPSAIEDETVVETMARVAAGDIDIDTFEPSFREKFVEFMNKLAKMLGLKAIAVNSPRMEVKRLADQLSKALNEGGKLSDIVGKKNVGKFQNALVQPRITAEEVLSKSERGDKKVVEVADAFEKAVDDILDPQSDPDSRITRFLQDAYEDLRYFLAEYQGDVGLDWYTNKVKEFNLKLENASDIAIQNGEMSEDNSLRNPDNMDLFKVVLALSSIGVNPRENVKAAFAIWKTFDQQTKTFSKYQPGQVSLRTNISDGKGAYLAPSGEIVKDTKNYLDIKQKDGKVVRVQKSDLAKEVSVTYVDSKGKEKTQDLRLVKANKANTVFRKGSSIITIKNDSIIESSEISDGIQGKGWTTKGNVVAINLSRVESLLADQPNLKSAIDWINEKHPISELRKYNSGVPDIEGGKGKINPKGERIGSYIIGEKLGAFHQNVAGTPTELTMDLWWSRTWNRYMGTLLGVDKDGQPIIQETPRTDNERNVMREAAKTAADNLGLEVHELQAALWYMEQQLYKRMGAAVESYSFVDGIDQLLLKYGKSKEEIQPERYGIDSTEADKRRTDAAARAADILYGTGGKTGKAKPVGQPSKGIKRGSNLVKDTYYESGLTEDKNDYVFFHVSSAPEASIRKGIDSTKYTSLRTAREEKGLQYGVASYYTRPEDGERMVGGEKYAVRVPKGKVYPIDSDPLGYGEKAEAKVPQGTPFRGEAVKREIADMAKKNGYEMIVGEWSYSRTGKPAGELPEFRADALVPLKPTKEKPESFTSNAEKGMERIPFPSQQSEQAKQELESIASEVRDIMSSKKKFSSKEYQLADSVYMNGQVTENKYEDNEFKRDITPEEYDMMTKVLPKSMQADAARVRGLLFGKKGQASIGIPRSVKQFSDNVSETVDRIKTVTGEDGATLNLDGTNYEDGGLVVPAGSINVAQDDVSAEGLFEFLKDNEGNISSDIFKIGLYRFPDRPEVSYDLNIVIPREYRDVALKFGELAGQESLFDLDTFENIKTGSDGKNPRKFTAQELAEIAKDLSEGRLPKIVSEETVGYRGLPGEYVEDYNGIQYFAENEKYAGVFGKNIVKANISKNKVLDLAKWNKKLKDAGIPDNGMGQPFLTIDQSMFDENRNFTTKGREGTFGKMKRAIGLDEFNKFKEEFDNADVIYGEDTGNVGEKVYAVRNPKAISVGKRGQPSMVKRTAAEVQQLMGDSMDAVDQDIADGVDAQTAVEDNITSQDWYGELTPKQKEQFDEIIKDEFGVTPKAPVAKPTGVKATISNIIDNYYKLKDGDRSARAAINEILDTDPKLKYIYDNISKINKQLQDAGVITDKTDGCP